MLLAGCLGAVRRHLRHRFGRHVDLPAETAERQRMADQQEGPARMGGRGPEAYGGAGVGRQGRVLLRPVVPVLQGEDHLPEACRGEPEARAARVQSAAGALRRGDRGHPLPGGRAGLVGVRHQGVRAPAGAFRQGVARLQARRGQVRPQVRQ